MTDLYLFTLATVANGPTAEGTSLLRIIQSGGIIGYIIILLSVLALTMIIMHLVQIRRQALVPPQQVEALDGLLGRGDVAGALQFCLHPDNDSFMTRILAAGLTRFQRSAFGAFEIKTTIEEAGEEQVARLYRATDVLSVVGTISPLLGLLEQCSASLARLTRSRRAQLPITKHWPQHQFGAGDHAAWLDRRHSMHGVVYVFPKPDRRVVGGRWNGSRTIAPASGIAGHDAPSRGAAARIRASSSRAHCCSKAHLIHQS